MSQAALLTIAETAVELRGEDTPANRDLVRGMIFDGRLGAIKQRGRWFVQRASLEEIVTPRMADARPAAAPPRRVQVRGRVARP